MTELTKRAKPRKRILGDVLKIMLGDGTHTYARVLPDASYAFYDSRGTEEVPVQQVILMPVLFIVAAMDDAVKEGRWIVVGHAPFNGDPVLPPKFIQDPLDKNKFSLYENGLIRPAKRQECIGLERAAVWDPANVEDRLRDHYAGRKNETLELQKIRT
jgi:hypothetical protein